MPTSIPTTIDRIQVEVRQKTATGDWATYIHTAGDRLAIPSLGITLAIADLYEDVAGEIGN